MPGLSFIFSNFGAEATNALLFLTLLFTPPVDNFRGADALDRPSWWISGELCITGQFETRLTATNGVWVIEARDNLGTTSNWYRIGAPMTAPSTNWQTLAIPAPRTGTWFYRVRQLP